MSLNIRNDRPLPIGWVPHKSLIPLRHELQRLYPTSFDFHVGEQSLVNRWLSEGSIALAPCSTTCVLTNTSHEIAFPVGVATDGAKNIVLGLQVDDHDLLEYLQMRNQQIAHLFHQARSQFDQDARQAAQFIWQMSRQMHDQPKVAAPLLQFTPNSANSSGAILAKILYRLWFGDEAFGVNVPANGMTTPLFSQSIGRSSMRLVVCDEALLKARTFANIIDLAHVWKAITGFPFVLSIWQFADIPVSFVWRRRMIEAAELAQARMQIDPSVYLPDTATLDETGRPIDLAAYWKGIQYSLNVSHMKSLLLFLCLARYLPSAQFNEYAVIKIMRWQQQSSAAEKSQI